MSEWSHLKDLLILIVLDSVEPRKQNLRKGLVCRLTLKGQGRQGEVNKFRKLERGPGRNKTEKGEANCIIEGQLGLNSDRTL